MITTPLIRNTFSHAPKGLDSLQISRVWTDSRTSTEGDLFAAISGEKFDGHDYIIDAAKRGATAALVSRSNFKDREKLPASFVLIEVSDTTEALRLLAKKYRQTLTFPIFAVAGSNGKTTTKEWLAYLLAKFDSASKVFKTDKSQNSILGIALSLLQIRDHSVAVIEIGIDEPGWMDQHLEVVAPTHGLITTIAEEHLNRLKSLEIVADEELKLLKYLLKHQGGFAANKDVAWVRTHEKPANSLTYALHEKADIEGSYSRPQTLNAFGLSWVNPLPGEHNALNLLAALTGLRLLHPEIERAHLERLHGEIASFEGEAHRSRLITGENNIRLFDDCYNANPDSMEKSLQAFSEMAEGCHHHLVLGDMLDLGDSSATAHQRILNLAMVSGAEYIYLLGPQFKTAWGKNPRHDGFVATFDNDVHALSTSLLANLKTGEAVFLKGSRGMRLERVIEALKTAQILG